MKIFAFITFFAIAFSSWADLTLENISPHFSTNAEIVWQAPMNHLPKKIWTYKKEPQIFSAMTISNAIILALFQSKGFPKPSTNEITIWADHSDGEPDPPYFSILPAWGQMSFTLGDREPDSPEGIETNQAAVERAWSCLAQLGLDRSQFIKTNDAYNGTWGIFLPRQLDGIPFIWNLEGFQIQFRKEKATEFCLLFPKLKRDRQWQIATSQQIVACIRAFKTPWPPEDEPDYFGRLEKLASAKKVVIAKITPYYTEGIYGESPKNDETPKTVTPVAELDVIADLGNSNTVVHLLAPITSPDAARLLEKKR